MRVGLNTVTQQSRLMDHTTQYQMDVEDSYQPVLLRMLALPAHDLTTKAALPIAEPLGVGRARLHHVQHLEATSDATYNTLRAFGVTVVAAAVLTGACITVAPMVGSTALLVNGIGAGALTLKFASVALRERVISEAMRVNYLVSAAYDDMNMTPSDEDMAQEYALRVIKAVHGAHMMGVIDPRLYPAVKQFVDAYNRKFAEPYEVL